jgi:PAS domain S-box-containing protein
MNLERLIPFADVEEIDRPAASRVATLIEASPLAIVTFDPEGVVTMWNPAAERIFGWSENEALGTRLPFVPAEKQEESLALRRRALLGEVFTEPELHRRRVDGSPVVVSVSTSPLRRPDGTIFGIMSILMDVTERKAAEEARDRQTIVGEQLRQSQKMDAVRRLAGGVAHDFNNLLTAISGHSDLLLPHSSPGTETILLTEDEEGVRRLAREILSGNGYKVLEAGNGREALLLSEGHRGGIHLLLTDVMMPKMGGRELVERIRLQRPDLRILYMSGYTDDAILRHGVMENGIPFLQKPFTAEGLARKVREVLDVAS